MDPDAFEFPKDNKEEVKQRQEDARDSNHDVPLLTTQDLINQVHGTAPKNQSAAAAASQPETPKLIEPKVPTTLLEGAAGEEKDKKKKKPGKFKRFLDYLSRACTNEREQQNEDEEGDRRRPMSAPRRESFKGQRLIDAQHGQAENERLAKMK